MQNLQDNPFFTADEEDEPERENIHPSNGLHSTTTNRPAKGNKNNFHSQNQ
jgi:hypothetical protein